MEVEHNTSSYSVVGYRVSLVRIRSTVQIRVRAFVLAITFHIAWFLRSLYIKQLQSYKWLPNIYLYKYLKGKIKFIMLNVRHQLIVDIAVVFYQYSYDIVHIYFAFAPCS